MNSSTPALEDVGMKEVKLTAGERMIESAKQALAFAKGEKGHGCQVHVAETTAEDGGSGKLSESVRDCRRP